MPPFLVMIFGALLGGAVLGYPLFLVFAVLLAGVVNTPWGLLLAAAFVLTLLILAVGWLRRPAERSKLQGALLFGSLIGGAFWFSRFGLAGRATAKSPGSHSLVQPLRPSGPPPLKGRQKNWLPRGQRLDMAPFQGSCQQG